MNYYEHHIGDFDQATAHLTACEDGIYSRLIRRYYATEKPLPVEVSAVQRLVRARTKEEKQAVSAMLTEFFHLEADGWHQSRCDETIAQYRDGEPEREARKANEETRLKRHREERAALFKTLTDAGQHAPWNIGMKELRELATRTATGPTTKPATAPATPATATQAPIPNHQTPDTNPQTPSAVIDLRSQTSKSKISPGGSATPARKRVNGNAPTSIVWKAYSGAYLDRYGTEPVQNAKVNGQLANFITRIAQDEAPDVAAYYVRHNKGLYVSARHPVDLLLRDAEGLRTQWATGIKSTALEARSAEQVDSVSEQIRRVGRELEQQ